VTTALTAGHWQGRGDPVQERYEAFLAGEPLRGRENG
jgi:hypothetical protein